MKHVLLLLALVSLNANATSLVSLDAQMQNDCFVQLVKAGTKPSQAHKFCRSIYGK